MIRWALVGGARGGEKSLLAADLARRLASAGVRIGGFAQRGDTSGEHKQYEVVRLRDGSARRLAWSGGGPKEGEPGVCSFCSLLFDLRSFEEARRWLHEDARASDVLFVDEVGKLEVAGRGHRDALSDALARESCIVVLGVRAEPLFSVVETFGLGDAIASIDAPASDAERGAFVEAIRSAVQNS